MAKYYAIIAAGGSGQRMGAARAKQYLKLENGRFILDQTLAVFLPVPEISGVVVALAEDDRNFERLEFSCHPKIIARAKAGKRRVDSVFSALLKLSEIAAADDWILVHDAVRPCVAKADIHRLMENLDDHRVGGILATPVVETLKRSENMQITETLDRRFFWRAQTPQMYRFDILFAALENAVDKNLDITDEAGAVERLGHSSMIIRGSEENIKITTPADIVLANCFLAVREKS